MNPKLKNAFKIAAPSVAVFVVILWAYGPLMWSGDQEGARVLIGSSLPRALIWQGSPKLEEAEFLEISTRALADVSSGAKESAGTPPPKVAVTLWATWCEPCVRELTVIQKNLPKFRAAGIQPLLINYDGGDPEQTPGFIASWMQERGLNLATSYDFDENLLREFSVAALPFAFGFDQKKEILWAYLGEMDWSARALVKKFPLEE